ncbi:class I SAM-dependent methyltransferase [Flindersiella endophytica]
MESVEPDSAEVRYDDLLASLRTSYDGGAATRDTVEKGDWKLAQRSAFLERLRAEGARRLLEVGAGTGQDSSYFLDAGLDVRATDLSPEMVERCRAKGIDAQVMDFLHLDFPPSSFDAVYAMNCLLHVPNADLPEVLSAIAGLLVPGGLFFLGVYGGKSGEGVADWDSHVPPRFFSWRSDEQIQAFAAQAFEIVDFHVVGADDYRFQSLTLRRPA